MRKQIFYLLDKTRPLTLKNLSEGKMSDYCAQRGPKDIEKLTKLRRAYCPNLSAIQKWSNLYWYTLCYKKTVINLLNVEYSWPSRRDVIGWTRLVVRLDSIRQTIRILLLTCFFLSSLSWVSSSRSLSLSFLKWINTLGVTVLTSLIPFTNSTCV